MKFTSRAHQNFIASLYSGAFYAVAPGLGLGAGLRNLLILGAARLRHLGAALLTVGTSSTVGGRCHGGRIPVIHAKRTARAEGPQPCGDRAERPDGHHRHDRPERHSARQRRGWGLPARGGHRSLGKTLQPIVYDFDPPGLHLDARACPPAPDDAPLALVVDLGVLTFYFLVGNAAAFFRPAPATGSAGAGAPTCATRTC
jgi:hypothetical protein